MFRIAICDDELEQLTATAALLHEYGDLHPELGIQVSTFSNAALMMEQLRVSGSFELYLLDVIMPGSNGIELGKKIRALDRVGYIFYLTTSPDYAVDSYLVRASQYLLKPVSKLQLFAALDEAAEIWQREHQSFVTLKTRDGLRRLAIRTVVYGELVGHNVRYYLADGTTLESMSVRTAFRGAVAQFLEYDRFVLCSASFLVNLSYVESIDAAGLRLRGGQVLPLSRSLRSEVTKRWLDHHLKGGVQA